VATILSQEYPTSILHYEPETGWFRWKKKIAQKVVVGRRAGGLRGDGYRLIKISGKRYYEHRLAWFYQTGSWPNNDIDHKNLNRCDNAWNNLRQATRSQNTSNTKIRITNLSNYKGVTKKGKRSWQARIRVNGQDHYLGTFLSPELAHSKYCEAAQEFHAEFARFN
jgi:hypothetical protein